MSIDYGYDPSDDWGEATVDVECPECGVETPDLDVTASGHGRRRVGRYRRYRSVTYSAECPACGHDWEWDEQDESEPDDYL
jgi:endogenous inhibitor of DNA gyrase (YacG/DUF329 family)